MIEELHEEMAEQAEAAGMSFPRNYKSILEDFRSIDTDDTSPAKVRSALRRPGIFDEPKKRRYWVDKEGRNCFMLYARALTIAWDKYSRHWRWYPLKVTSDVSVDVAELLEVCWLEVNGVFETEYLTPGTVYEVSYVIKLKDQIYGWEDQVNFSLTLPQNAPKTCKCDLRKLPRARWIYILIGEFTPSSGQSGRMDFTLRQTVGIWKKGLVILGVDISPKL